ncbi:MAG: ABC transporter ATP-binding protein [Aminobacterium sp.]|jgi:iron(III) transport system ATP-binding protein|uniref:ABC transporter ATP-binding protein n=1 Tax=unclassified Aminobacterium TaxID=2685012 RepID=UPI001BCC842B|nr:MULTISPECIES: ABC transporter ATP-binding protein [unclassified Aminobacterium]MDD2207283.1 ABC transporter ATP-binding protein [Aminobacterium sp.]MDD3425281.1 ABC transporter ATP-binding protein [Aminobacterium sp.]MDD3708231.1 ABC transporter ATP-binding protein [Aminobacterium sp.]MDD4229146.1 ABC transporter ATP-binding protein [Aminobacterium sp.]MDD4552012.1 ABC transporter ATP-binding protein [Aminobacterium sp.]
MYLQLKQLNKKFGNVRAVIDFSLNVQEGELVSLLGPSGCGKTTTLRMVGGFLQPNRGEIILEGENITSLPPEKRPTATVFQSYALFPHMDVLENVTYGLKFKKIARKKTLQMGLEMLEKVGLPNAAAKTIDQLSGGEQQRVALARSLITQPKVLLLDEPLSNLDAKLRIRMRREIRQIQKDFGITALYVTHDQEEALALSDRVVVMEKGSITQVDTPRKIYTSAQNSFVADFIGRSNIFTLKGNKKIAVHPEDISLSEEHGQYEGIIVGHQFKGAMTTYFIAVEKQVIEADILSRIDQNWEEGRKVKVTFNKESIMPLF